MTKLTQAQHGLLCAAAATSGGAVDASAGSKAIVAGLIKRELIISIPQAGGPSQLMITQKGRDAINSVQKTALDVPEDDHAVPVQASAAHTPKGKIAKLVALLLEPDGTTVAAMMEATGWQAHSVRGAMSGAIKKGLGMDILSEKSDHGRRYRLARFQA